MQKNGKNKLERIDTKKPGEFAIEQPIKFNLRYMQTAEQYYWTIFSIDNNQTTNSDVL